MQLSKSAFALTSACLLLVGACGSEAPENVAAEANDPMTETTSDVSEEAETASYEAEAAPLMFDTPTLDKSDLDQLTLFGVKIGMSPAEVEEAIVSREFEKPQPTEGVAFVRYSPFAIECDAGADEDPCETAGFIQAGALEWTRGENDEEKLIPLFYIDRDLNQKLYALDYKRTYDPAIDPENILEDMIERYGTPSDTSNYKGKSLRHQVQMPMPAGFIPTPEDERHGQQTGSQRQVVDTRFTCLKTEIKNFPEPRTASCETLLDAPAQPQHQYMVLLGNYSLDGVWGKARRAGNSVLNIKIVPDELQISLNGSFLAVAEQLIDNEARYQTRLDELKARQANDVGISDDL
jgi:hypothetical protein